MEPLLLAKIIIDHCIEVDNPATNLQLQKILYFLQLKSIIEDGFDKRIILEPCFEAWRFGPVIPIVYNMYRRNGGLKITCSHYQNKKLQGIEIPTYVNNFIDSALKVKPFKLVALSHNDEGAWKSTYVEGQKKLIKDELVFQEARIIQDIDKRLGCHLFYNPHI